MNKKEMEKRLYDLGYWLIELGNNLFQIQNYETGNYEDERYNLETLENRIEIEESTLNGSQEKSEYDFDSKWWESI